MTLSTALAAFDRGVANLPGVTARPGEFGRVDDGSQVVSKIRANFSRLTPGQREAFERAVAPARDAIVIPADEPTASAAGAGGGAGGGGTASEREIAQLAIDLARRVLRSHGFPLTREIKVSYVSAIPGGANPQWHAFTDSADLPPGRSPTCNITVLPRGRAIPGRLAQLLAHEYAHCVQHSYADSQAELGRWPGWVDDGAAEWLAIMVVAEGGIAVDPGWFNAWLDSPEADLFTRSYSAAGYWAMIHQATGDGWKKVRDVYAVASSGSPAAYRRSLAGLPDVFHDRWGAGLHRQPSFGPEWDYTAPSMPDNDPTKYTIGTGGAATLITHARGSTAGDLSIRAEVLTVSAPRHARGLFRSEGRVFKLRRGAYCTRPGGCQCRTRTNLALPRVGRTGEIGFNGRNQAATVILRGRTLAAYCRKPEVPPAPDDTASCPTTPPTQTASARAAGTPGGGGTACTDEAFFTLNHTNNPPDAIVRSMDCTAGSSFVAIGTSANGYRLEIGIKNFAGFNREYPWRSGDDDVVIQVDGPAEWATTNPPKPPDPRVPGVGSGKIFFDQGGRRVRGGGGPIYTEAGMSGPVMVVGGGARCTYPDD